MIYKTKVLHLITAIYLLLAGSRLPGQNFNKQSQLSRYMAITICVNLKTHKSNLEYMRIDWETPKEPTKGYELGGRDFELITLNGSVVPGWEGGITGGTSEGNPAPEKVYYHIKVFSEEDGVGYRLRIHPKKGETEVFEEHIQDLGTPKISCVGNGLTGFKVEVDQPVRHMEFHWSLDEGKTWVRNGVSSGSHSRFMPSVPIPLERRLFVELQVSIGLRCYRKRFLLDGTLKPVTDPHAPLVPFMGGLPQPQDLIKLVGGPTSER